jgi:ABC-type Zn2+ transport system substrate-binding protein/surface adhesin
VFKKAGIVLAVSAAGLLAVSPLAFAGDYSDNDGGHGHHSKHHGGDDNDGDHDGDHGDHDGDDDNDNGGNRTHLQSGLVNLQDVGVQVPVQACNNSILTGALGILSLGTSNSDSHDGKCGQKNDND